MENLHANQRKLNVVGWVSPTTTEGPGARFALWLQGCPFRCPGCCNSQMLEFREAHIISVVHMLQVIIDEKKNIEGVTFLGGEPMIQAKGLAILAEHLQSIDLSVMVFTGYTYEFLKKGKLPGALELLANTDVLVDGLYSQALPETKRKWIGSKNQKIYYLSKRYPPKSEMIQEETIIEKASAKTAQKMHYQREMEIRFSDQGNSIIFNGWPMTENFQDSLVRQLQKHGIKLYKTQ